MKDAELNGYVIFIAICGWIIGAIIFLPIRRHFLIYKRKHIPVIFDAKGIYNISPSKKGSKTINIYWKDITKIARSASGKVRSFNKDQIGTITAFYTHHDGKNLRCMLDWSLFGFKGMQEKYKQIHYFVVDHAEEGCELVSYPDRWPQP